MPEVRWTFGWPVRKRSRRVWIWLQANWENVMHYWWFLWLRPLYQYSEVVLWMVLETNFDFEVLSFAVVEPFPDPFQFSDTFETDNTDTVLESPHWCYTFVSSSSCSIQSWKYSVWRKCDKKSKKFLHNKSDQLPFRRKRGIDFVVIHPSTWVWRNERRSTLLSNWYR